MPLTFGLMYGRFEIHAQLMNTATLRNDLGCTTWLPHALLVHHVHVVLLVHLQHFDILCQVGCKVGRRHA